MLKEVEEAELGLGAPRKKFWMRDYWDRFIRDETHFYSTVTYIHDYTQWVLRDQREYPCNLTLNDVVIHLVIGLPVSRIGIPVIGFCIVPGNEEPTFFCKRTPELEIQAFFI